MDENDFELVAKSIAGDDQAFEKLMVRYGPLLRSYIRWNCQSRMDAEDILHESWISIYRNLENLNDSKKLSSWMIQIAKRRVADFYRKPDFSAKVGEEAVDANLFNRMPRVTPIERNEKLEAIEAAMERLPERLRRVIYMKLWEEMTVPEIARLTGLKESAVKMRIQRGLKQLRQYLIKHGYDMM